MIPYKKRGVNWILPVTPLSHGSDDDIQLYLVSSPSCVSIAAPKKVPRRIAAVAKSAIVL